MAFHNYYLTVILCIALAVISSHAFGKSGHSGGRIRPGGKHGPHPPNPWTPKPGSVKIPYPTKKIYICRGSGTIRSNNNKPSNPPSKSPPGSKTHKNPPRYGGYSHPSQSTVYYHKYIHYVPTYYNAPQFVYITEYRHSNSRYSNLLTGLAVYNLGRSHHHHQYYYHDLYSRKRFPDSYSTPTKPEDNANCNLIVQEHGQVSPLSIPCEIVSTFALTNTVNTTAADCRTAHGLSVKGTVLNGTLENATLVNGELTGGRLVNGTLANGILVNCTAVNTTVFLVDQLQMKAWMPDMKCAVEVRTQMMFTSKDVDCGELIRYSEMPEPQPEQPMVPSANTYRFWINSPPWWLSFLFVV